jgi:hypothetical protein
MEIVSCVECGEPCRGMTDGAPSRCRACHLFREVYPLPPDIETT